MLWILRIMLLVLRIMLICSKLCIMYASLVLYILQTVKPCMYMCIRTTAPILMACPALIILGMHLPLLLEPLTADDTLAPPCAVCKSVPTSLDWDRQNWHR